MPRFGTTVTSCSRLFRRLLACEYGTQGFRGRGKRVDNYQCYWNYNAKIGLFLTVPFFRNSLDRNLPTRDTPLSCTRCRWRMQMFSRPLIKDDRSYRSRQQQRGYISKYEEESGIGITKAADMTDRSDHCQPRNHRLNGSPGQIPCTPTECFFTP